MSNCEKWNDEGGKLLGLLEVPPTTGCQLQLQHRAVAHSPLQLPDSHHKGLARPPTHQPAVIYLLLLPLFQSLIPHLSLYTSKTNQEAQSLALPLPDPSSVFPTSTSPCELAFSFSLPFTLGLNTSRSLGLPCQIPGINAENWLR